MLILYYLLSWVAGTLFIPSLALALGVHTGGSKAFEVIFVLWISIAPQNIQAFDFISVTPGSLCYIYMLVALAQMILAVFARQRQLKSESA